MCSLIMPADYEMLVSHSPPVFSHSPPTGYLSDYTAMRFGPEAFSRVARASCRSTSPGTRSFHTKTTTNKMPASPKRPCLVTRADDSQSSSDEDPTSPTRLKKKVVFADDRGMSLTQVRIMSEPSNVPPLWSLRFLSQVTQGISAEPVSKEEWEITFSQPASDYVQFRQRLDTAKVSLENVIIKENEEIIMGTVKVRNLSYQKEVVVRVSSNKWKSYEDAFCKYVPNSASNSVTAAYVLYDTFSFKLPIPPNARRIEFCVCFRCDEQEYWDNNDGKNYVIIRKSHSTMHKSHSADELQLLEMKNKLNDISNGLKSKCTDALQTKLESWSEFASWTHLENSNPYW